METLGTLADLMEERRYPRGTLITRNGEINQNVFIVSRGLLRVSACSESGKRITFLLVKTGEPYNLLSPFMTGPRFLEAEAAFESRCLVLTGSDYRQFLAVHPEVLTRVITWVAPSLDSAVSRIFDQMEKKVEIRILRVLKTLYAKFGSPLLFTSNELSELAGTTPESTLRAMAVLRDLGAIETRRGKIWIKDEKFLHVSADKNIKL